MHAGGYTPFGIEGWRVVFLTVGIISFALGILNYFFAHDPRYAQDNKSVLKEHQHSMSFWGAIAEMKRIVVIPSFAIIILQVSCDRHIRQNVSCSVLQSLFHSRSCASAASDASLLCVALLRASLSYSAHKDCLYTRAFLHALLVIAAYHLLWLGSQKRFSAFDLQGVAGSIPFQALVFFTLYFQLLGFSNFAASALMSGFLFATAFGGLLGGWIGDK